MAAKLVQLLRKLLAADGIHMVALISMEGRLIDVAQQDGIDAQQVAEAACNGLLMARALGFQLGQGEPVQTIIEYQAGLLLLEPVDEDLGLVMLATRDAKLGRMRLVASRYREEILHAASIGV